MFVLHPIEAWINHRSYIYLYISLVLLLKASICVFTKLHLAVLYIRFWTSHELRRPVVITSLVPPIPVNGSLINRSWNDRTSTYFCGKRNGSCVERGLPNLFQTTSNQYPDIFEVFRCPEQLVTVLDLIARPTELCLLNCEADGIRVLPGTLSCSGKRQSFGNDFRRPNDFKTHREEPRTIPRDQRGARRTSGLKQVEF